MSCKECRHLRANGDCEMSFLCPGYPTLRLMNLMRRAQDVKRNH